MDAPKPGESSAQMPVVAAVDDSPAVLRALGQMLSRSGYRTLLFDDPRTELRIEGE